MACLFSFLLSHVKLNCLSRYVLSVYRLIKIFWTANSNLDSTAIPQRALPTTWPDYVVLTGPTLAQARINGFTRKPYRLHTRLPCWSNGRIKTPLMLRFEPQRLGLRALLFIASYLRSIMVHRWTTSGDFPVGHPPGTTPTCGSLN